MAVTRKPPALQIVVTKRLREAQMAIVARGSIGGQDHVAQGSNGGNKEIARCSKVCETLKWLSQAGQDFATMKIPMAFGVLATASAVTLLAGDQEVGWQW